jgi:anti-repressor protein
MNELVFKSEKGNPVTTSLLVAKKFGKDHNHIVRDIQNIIEKGSAQNWTHPLFFESTYIHPQNGQSYRMYIMNRDGFSLLVMGFTGEKAMNFKLDFIIAFNKMEQTLKAQLPQDYLSALKALVASEEQKQLAEAKVKEMEPKALFADSVNASSSSILIGDLAKILKQNGVSVGQNRLFQWLRENSYLGTKGEYYNKPTQKAMDLGLFEVVERTQENRKDNSIFITFTTKVTGKGQLYFVNKFLKQKAA